MRLKKDLLVEFAGMPKSGKTTVLDSVSHALRRKDIAVQEFHGGGRYAPIDKTALESLNLYLACQIGEFVIATAEREREKNKVFLLDRGPADRILFTKALERIGRIDTVEATALTSFLGCRRMASCIDLILVFTTSTDLSISRENKNKIVTTTGRVMNPSFLDTLSSVTRDNLATLSQLFPRVIHIDTAEYDNRIAECVAFVLEAIGAGAGGAD